MKIINYENVCGIIVTFNGSKTIKNSITGLKNNVNSIIIIDNCSTDDTVLIVNQLGIKSIILIQNSANLGLAEGLNIGYKQAKKLGFTWILTLDQDTILYENVVSEVSKVQELLTSKPYKIGIYSLPLTSSKKSSDNFFRLRNYVITSGNIVSVNALDKVGGFTSKLFIDSVDFDLCLKLKKYRFRIVECSNALMKHNIGNLTVISFFSLRFKVYLHSQKRKYFMIRNHIYIFKNYFFVSPFFIIKKSLFLFLMILRTLVLEPKKRESINFIFTGFYHGLINNFSNKINEK
jgi:rhamnosyltransferase